VDVAKQLDERDAAHKAEVDQLKGRISELLDEKEQRKGQLKKAQELLVTSEADASSTHAKLDGLKEQATRCYVSDMFPASVEDIEKALQLDRENRGVLVALTNWDMSE
jgi:chromosome segregation ATPase